MYIDDNSDRGDEKDGNADNDYNEDSGDGDGKADDDGNDDTDGAVNDDVDDGDRSVVDENYLSWNWNSRAAVGNRRWITVGKCHEMVFVACKNCVLEDMKITTK